MNEHEQGYGVIKDVKQAKEAAKQALQDGLGGWFPAACVVLAKALDDAEKRAAPQAEPSDEELLELGKQIEQSIDPRYEFVDVVRTLLARYGQPAAGEEIMVNAAHDVYTLPLQPSGLDGQGPRFVVHVPPPEPQAAEIEALRAEVDGWKAQHSRDSAELRRLCQHRDEYKARAERLAEALALLPDEIVMVEHNPYEGPLMFCCGQRVTLSWRHGLIPTHSKECWYARMSALRDHDQEDRNG